MAKNALQSVLDVVKRGATRLASVTPVGQLASRVAQATQTLRVPSLEELENTYRQSVGRVSSAVQKYPTPVSYVAPRIRQYIPEVRIPTTPSPQEYARVRFPQTTFSKNMQLLPRALTTETPVARFLFEKIGGPGLEDVKGPPTIGKYIAGVTEASLPGLLPISGGPQLARNILREGVNIPAALKSGAALTAFNVALQKLKGEKVSAPELATSFGFGALFGIAAPTPLTGISTAELGMARRTLTKYGFELKDYETPALLKAKFRRAVLNLHPDKGGNPEEFSAFIDAYNKTTSAGISGGWGLPDILTWIRNIWTKKAEAKPKGIRLLPSVEPPQVVRELRYPKELPPTIETRLRASTGGFRQDTLRRLEQGKMTTGDLERVGIKQNIRRIDLVTLLKNSPELAQNPVLTVGEDGMLRFAGQKQQFSIVPEALGITTPLTPGEVISLKNIIGDKGTFPVLVSSETQVGRTPEQQAQKIADIIRQESGIGSHVFEGEQIRTVLQKAGLETISEGIIDTPGFIVQYLKRDLATGESITPRLTVNVFPTEAAQAPAVQPLAPVVPITPKVPTTPPVVAVPKPLAMEETPAQTTSFGGGTVEVVPTKVVQHKGEYLAQIDKVLGMGKVSDVYYWDKVEKRWAYLEANVKPYKNQLDRLVERIKPEKPAPVEKVKQQEVLRENRPPEEVRTAALEVPKQMVPELGYEVELPHIVAVKVLNSFGDITVNSGFQTNFKPPVWSITIQGKASDDAVRAARSLGLHVRERKVDGTKQLFTDIYLPKIGADEVGIQKATQVFDEFALRYNTLKQTPQPIPEKPAPVIQIPKPGEKEKGFLKTALESETTAPEVKKVAEESIYKFYTPKKNKAVFEKMRPEVEKDFEGWVQRIKDPNQAWTDEVNAAGQVAMLKLQQQGRHEEAAELIDALDEKGRIAGRSIQIFSNWDFLTPEGMIRYGQRMIRKSQEKVSFLAEIVGKGNAVREIPESSRKTADELNKVNQEVAEQVAQEVSAQFGKTARRLVNREELEPEEKLGKRVINYVKSLDKKQKEEDPVQVMVNTLYAVAREVLPEKTVATRDPLEFVAKAIKERKTYQFVWDEAKRIVEEKFAKDPKAIEKLDDYFAYYLNRPFTKSQLERTVGGQIKVEELDLGQVVREFYVDLQRKVGQNLSAHLAERAGLVDEDARMLETFVTKRFDELTRAKKEQILTAFSKQYPKTIKKTLWEELIQLSNLGAFSDKKYYDIIAKRTGIPNLNENVAQALYKKTQHLQSLPEGSKERFEATREAIQLMADQIPLGLWDIFDAYRYQGLLSSPRTQQRNIIQNLFAATMLRPAVLSQEVVIDWVQLMISGKEREVYMKQVPAYYKGLINALPTGVEALKNVFRGVSEIEQPDLRMLKFLKLRKEHRNLTIATNLMEGMDKFFSAIISSGEYASLREQGVPEEEARALAHKIAEEYLLRAPTDPNNLTGQGALWSRLDKVTNGIANFRRDIPGMTLFVPFIRTVANYAKQNLQFVPAIGSLGALSATGEQQRQQQAKAAVGLYAVLFGYLMAISGNTTWDVPADKDERQKFWDSGKRPYAIRIGNWWVPMIYLGPLTLALAIPAAFKHYEADARTALTDTWDKPVYRSILGLAKMFSNLSMISNIGGFLRIIEGDDDFRMDDLAASILSQGFPLIGLSRYISTLADPVYRKSEGVKEGLMKSIPFLSKGLEPYRTLTGEESKRNLSSYILPYDINREDPAMDYLLRQRRLQLQRNAIINQLKKDVEVPENIKAGSEEEYTYASEHPEVAYESMLNSLQRRLSETYKQETEIHLEKEITDEERLALTEEINVQKEELLQMLDQLYKEIKAAKGEQVTKNIFTDEVEAADFEQQMQPVLQEIGQQQDAFIKSSQTLTQQLKELRSQSEKYKQIRGFFDLAATSGGSFDRARQFAEKQGIPGELAEYDFWSAQKLNERSFYIHSLIDSMDGQSVFDTLVSLRRMSPGTGNMVLSDEIVGDLVDEGYISKSLGKQLRKIKIKLNEAGEPMARLQAVGTDGGMTKADQNKLLSIFKQRDNAYLKAMKIKPPKITVSKLKMPKFQAPKPIKIQKPKESKFYLRLAKAKKVKFPQLKNVVYATRGSY